ncbi:MAG TPA: hypothetical protein VM347_26640 [Nonomuraea sp.]|nr:hypothetical protein [Nonomuraea sp.]
MTTLLAIPPPDPDDGIARELAALERHLDELTPPPAAVLNDDTDDAGESRRVRRLRAEVVEARTLAALQDDDTPLLLDTDKVRRRRRKAHEAARLHLLGQDPAMRAWQAARMRRLLVVAAMLALGLALAWSTAGVQHFAAEGAAAWSPGWLFAWLVEPFMSIALLVVVGARAYLTTHGRPLDDRKLIHIEWLFLGQTLGMNAWPYLPWSVDDFSLSRLVLHILGPIVAVAIVTALPIILTAFAHLDHGATGRATAPSYRRSAVNVDALTAQARDLIAAGVLPSQPGAGKIRDLLRCGMDSARAVRDALSQDDPATGGQVPR